MMTDPNSIATTPLASDKTVTKPRRPRRWMPMSPRSVSTSLRGAKTQAIIPIREFPWAVDLQIGDKVDLRAKKNAQVRSLQVELVRVCRHVSAAEIPACGEHTPEAIAPWDPRWDRVLNVSRNARNPEGADERDQAGWVVITYIALNETRTAFKGRASRTPQSTPAAPRTEEANA